MSLLEMLATGGGLAILFLVGLIGYCIGWLACSFRDHTIPARAQQSVAHCFEPKVRPPHPKPRPPRNERINP